MKNLETILVICAFLIGCASSEKAQLMSSTPDQAIKEVQDLRGRLIESNSDLLAKKFFAKGDEDLDDAIEIQKEGDSAKEVMDELSQAKAHYLKARKIAETRKILPESILSARKNAVEAGLFESKELSRTLGKLDDSLRRKTGLFNKDLSAEKLSNFQSQYLELEVKAVQNMKLGSFRGIVAKAKDNDAADLAPNTFKKAKSDLNIAENLIRQSPRDFKGYEENVEQANRSAKLLDDVMNKLRGEAKGSSESVALKLVYQERKLGKLSETVGALQGSLSNTESELDTVSKRLVLSTGRALGVENKIRFQKAMDEVQNNLGEEEASVYQQGQDLIIRLKKINFKSGDASIPTSALALLSKVRAIVSELTPNEVIIEGHTDSVGMEAYNLMLSNKRADAVKQYFSSLGVKYKIDSKGLGETKPIASNQTKQGRSLNRRVDIVVKASR